MNPNQLVVEDIDTKGAVIGLMRHYVAWPKTESGWPVNIDFWGSADEVLNKAEVATLFKTGELSALGLIVDADSNFAARWDQVKDVCRHLGGVPPVNCPTGGLQLAIQGKKFGAWIMPDNNSAGMVENFCHSLVPNPGDQVWNFARQCASDAKTRGAPFNAIHLDKAHIRTWLAWQDPPGIHMGIALTRGILDPACKSAADFIAWFRSLYGV